MDNEIVLFLQERIPGPALDAALADIFGMTPDIRDVVLVVDYQQGFATGISMPCTTLPAQEAAGRLAARLGTAVLLESRSREHEESQWLLFVPGTAGPHRVRVVELRHGLDVIEHVPGTRHAVRPAYAGIG